jgi:type II secretory pathway pseudopilin PulG
MARGRHTGEGGFTVLRLIVVVVVVGLLGGVGALVLRTRAQTSDHLARRDTRVAALAADDIADVTGRAPTAEELAEYEPSLEYETLDPGEEVAVQGRVYVRVRGEVAELVARADDECYWIQDTPEGRRYAIGDCDGNPDDLRFTTEGW